MDSIGSNCCSFVLHVIYLWIEDLNKEPDEFRVFNRLILSILQTNHLISFHSVFRTWIHVLFLDFGVFFGISRIFFVLFFVRFKMSKLNPRAAVLRTTGTNTMKNPPSTTIHIDYHRTLCGYSIRLHPYIVPISRHKIYVPLSVCVCYDSLRVCRIL